jgi:multisubunit Na+/H+ antiporter MnhF subunit
MSVMTVTVIRLSREKSLAGMVTPKLLNDYGNLLLVFTMLWAYLSFSQFLIIWGGNLRDEVPWYMSRARGGWIGVAIVLILFHFAVPFLLLLTRFVKRRAELLRVVAAGLLVMSLVDIFWLLTPAFNHDRPVFHPTDLLAILGIGGLWLWRYTAQLQGRSLLPVNDPRLKELMQHA